MEFFSSLLFVCSLFFCNVAEAVPRQSAQLLLKEHASSLDEAVSLLQGLVKPELLSTHIGAFAAKEKGLGLPARETTLVDASLGMVDAVAAALQTSFPSHGSKVDVVLASTVAEIASCGGNIVNVRAHARGVIRRASSLVVGLNVALQALVPEFGRPIAARVNFALVEVMVRALGWKHSDLMCDLLFGFEPIGCVKSTGCLRPVSEPVPPAMTRASNVESFDKAVEHLERKAKKAGEQAVSDQWVVWQKALDECESGFCHGPLSRGQVESLFSSSEFGPRCIPAFGIWQKGKLRRIDDACRSGHNLLTQMSETIVCVSADLTADIAYEFYNFLSPDCRLKLGTDDIASAYRVLLSASPQYNEAAVWRPRAADGSGGHVSYFALRGFNFGLKSAPVHLATLMRPLVDFARKLLLVACDQFYDDVLVVDPEYGLSSAQVSLNFLFRLLGFPFARAKHERLRGANAFLGVVTDLSTAATGYVLLRVKEKRRQKLLSALKEILASNKLSPAHAARI